MLEISIKDKFMEKLEYDFSLLKEVILIEFKLYYFFPNNLELIEKFTKFVQEYYKYSLLEYKLLIKINKVKNNKNLEDLCSEIIDEIDNIFFKYFNYIEYVLGCYETIISEKNIPKSLVLDKEFDVLTEEKYTSIVKKLIK